MENTMFKWIPFYEELADKLLEYKNKPKRLVNLIYKHFDSEDASFLYDDSKKEMPIFEEIDPFTIYSIFNRKKGTRRELAQTMKDAFEISAESPLTFEGIPVQNYSNLSFVARHKAADGDAKRLWQLFELALSQDAEQEDVGKVFDRVLKQLCIGMAKITMGLYYIRPYDFLALDENNVNYLDNYGIKVDPKKMNYADYVNLMNEVKVKMKDKTIKEQSFPEFSLAAVGENYNEEINNEFVDEYVDEYVDLLRANHNLILTGAPGTGKTYLTKRIAQQMIFGKVKAEKTPDEEKQFNEQCEFVQFHPSYDYTDFVEGLRPTPPNKDGNVGFERKDGEFKVFCKKALLRSDSNETDIFNGINDNPKVWKVSLSGTGDNDIRKYCKENDCIRIDWKEYGNVEDFSEYDFKESEVAKDFRSRGLAVGEKILKSFQNEMEIGDIVVSCFSEKETDAIGIITGDYEYIEEWANDYPRCRKVRWIWKGTPNDIIGLNNNKKLTLSTIYKLDIDPITIKDYINKISGYSDSKKEERKFVFIIDEINRGEINKIFGELFFSIDPDYRGEKGKVYTQYQNMIEDGDAFKKGFFVPENVYIIGTMNDIDRSVESMDFAFRRRFAFKEVTAKESQAMLESDEAWNGKKPNDDTIEEIVDSMDGLNNAIWHKTKDGNVQKCCENMSAAYHIGASYFLKLAKYRNEKGLYDENSFEKLWKYHLEGLLREYLRGTPSVDEIIDKLKDAYDLNTDDDDDSTSDNGQPE